MSVNANPNIERPVRTDPMSAVLNLPKRFMSLALIQNAPIP